MPRKPDTRRELLALDSPSRRFTAHNLQDDSRDVAGIRVRGEEYVRRREFFGLGRPTHRGVFSKFGDLLWAGSGVGRIERRPDRARGNRVYANSFFDQVLSQRF